jgi:general secretion pathway protein B
MSLILEALRKSEAERRRGDTPNLHTELPPAPSPRRARFPAWGWILLAVLAMPLAWWAAANRAPPSRMPAPDTTAASTVITARAITPALPPVRRLSPRPEPKVATQPPVAAITAPVAAPTPDRVAPASAVPPPSTPKALVAPIARGESDGTVLLSDLSIEERKALPPLKLSMHMWNDDPARRFVILDGNRLGEGDRVGNAVITAITSDGAVIDWNGRRIRLEMH